MIDAVLERLFGKKSKGVSLSSLFVRAALVEAYARGHAEVDVDHVMRIIATLTVAQPLLSKRGVDPADVEAIVDQLFEERPSADELGGEPVLAPRLKTACERSVVGDRIALGAFLDNVAAAMPRELAFARPAFAAAAPEITAFFSAPLSSTPAGQLTFDAWEPQIRGVVGLMQKQTDVRFKSWAIGIFNFFFAVLTAKPLHDAFVARGVDVNAIVKETSAAFIARYGKKKHAPPPGFVASITPALYALFIRAERYAASDREGVHLRHVLAALHDEPLFAPAVEKIAR